MLDDADIASLRALVVALQDRPSRRERIASDVLRGLVANNDVWANSTYAGMAKAALEQADALIAALDAPVSP